MLLTLRSKEEQIGLFPQRYDDGGKQLLLKHREARTSQMLQTIEQFGARNIDIVDGYSRIDKSIASLAKCLRHSTTTFERKWKEDQTRLQASIVAAIKSSV